jgi:hypothetical protein
MTPHQTIEHAIEHEIESRRREIKFFELHEDSYIGENPDIRRSLEKDVDEAVAALDWFKKTHATN